MATAASEPQPTTLRSIGTDDAVPQLFIAAVQIQIHRAVFPTDERAIRLLLANSKWVHLHVSGNVYYMILYHLAFFMTK